MNAQDFSTHLREIRACDEAKEWATGKSFEEVWTTCDRGDWMLWLAKKMQDKEGWGDLRNLTMAKVKCASLVTHLMKDERSLNALAVAERFANGEATKDELDAAAYAAYAAYADAYADAADADAYADAYAAYAAYAAAYAYAAYAAARTNVLQLSAQICRDIIITPLNIQKQ